MGSRLCRALPALLVALILAACGGSTAPEPNSAPSAAASTAPASAAPSDASSDLASTPSASEPAASAAAPSAAASVSADANASSPAAAGARTIEHKYGSTTVEGVPERVVSVGFNEQDAILALGVVPVGIRDWYGEQPNAVWPWAQDELGGATPAVLPSNEINFEQIAALQPDLIVGISSGMTQEQFATLSEIAPTVPQSAEYVDYGVPWQEQQRVIGLALGREAAAEQLVADVEARFAAARDEHPHWDGANAVVAVAFDNEYSAFGPQDVRARVFSSLGLETKAEVAELAGDSFFTAISKERLDLLDTDVLVWVVNTDADRAAIEADPLVQQLAATREGRSIFLDQQLSGAASFSSVLSLPYLLDELVPQLEEATGAT